MPVLRAYYRIRTVDIISRAYIWRLVGRPAVFQSLSREPIEARAYREPIDSLSSLSVPVLRAYLSSVSYRDGSSSFPILSSKPDSRFPTKLRKRILRGGMNFFSVRRANGRPEECSGHPWAGRRCDAGAFAACSLGGAPARLLHASRRRVHVQRCAVMDRHGAGAAAQQQQNGGGSLGWRPAEAARDGRTTYEGNVHGVLHCPSRPGGPTERDGQGQQQRLRLQRHQLRSQ